MSFAKLTKTFATFLLVHMASLSKIQVDKVKALLAIEDMVMSPPFDR